jgi:phosphodiesterase/alkaline phosphatase D-like protein
MFSDIVLPLFVFWVPAQNVVVPAQNVVIGALTKGPYVTALGPTSAEVRFETDAPAPAAIELTHAGDKPRVIHDAATIATHVLRIDGLAPSTHYVYVVRANGRESPHASFVTAPKDEGASPFSFIVYGDNRTDDTSHAAIVRAILGTPCDFLVNTGDMVEDGGNASPVKPK